jgi:uncharacterized protein (DUF2147 family)
MFAFIAGALVAAGPPAAGDPNAVLLGTWLNSRRSIAVRAERCGDAVCGHVVWATAGAEEDARRGGVRRLVGTQVLTGFRHAGHTTWRGHVFVPERGRTFQSRITQLGQNSIRVDGCVLGGFLCGGETWQRRN